MMMEYEDQFEYCQAYDSSSMLEVELSVDNSEVSKLIEALLASYPISPNAKSKTQDQVVEYFFMIVANIAKAYLQGKCVAIPRSSSFFNGETVFSSRKLSKSAFINVLNFLRVEAIKIISFAIQKAKTKYFIDPRNYFNIPLSHRGIELNLDDIGIEQRSLFFRYDTPAPSKIIMHFTSGAKVEIYIGDDKNFAIFWKNKNDVIKNKKDATAFLPDIEVMPQPGPLLHEENLLTTDYVKKHVVSRRSVLHFRNHLAIFVDQFKMLRDVLPSTWKNLRIDSIEIPKASDKQISLFVSEGDFTAEVAWMGHGVQVWLQIIWFLCRTKNNTILILDEPDVYLHADLQRNLIRLLLQNKERQVIIATHSAEMLSEVKANSVIILNKQEKISQKATSNNAIQAILDNIGSVHNLSLMRMGIYRKVLFVEGKDISLLKDFQNTLTSYSSNPPIDVIPHASTGGWAGWPAIKKIAEFFNKNTESGIRVFCIFDRDYHTENEINEREQEAKDLNIYLHIWRKKEVENYLIVPAVITRLIEKRKKQECTEPISEEITKEYIEKFLDNERDNIVDQFAEAFRHKNKGECCSCWNRQAREIVSPYYCQNTASNIINGKDLFAELARWAQNKYKVSISCDSIFSEMRATEVDDEIKEVIDAILCQA